MSRKFGSFNTRMPKGFGPKGPKNLISQRQIKAMITADIAHQKLIAEEKKKYPNDVDLIDSRENSSRVAYLGLYVSIFSIAIFPISQAFGIVALLLFGSISTIGWIMSTNAADDLKARRGQRTGGNSKITIGLDKYKSEFEISQIKKNILDRLGTFMIQVGISKYTQVTIDTNSDSLVQAFSDLTKCSNEIANKKFRIALDSLIKSKDTALLYFEKLNNLKTKSEKLDSRKSYYTILCDLVEQFVEKSDNKEILLEVDTVIKDIHESTHEYSQSVLKRKMEFEIESRQKHFKENLNLIVTSRKIEDLRLFLKNELQATVEFEAEHNFKISEISDLLHSAIEREYFDILSILLEYGALPNHKTHNGWTPIFRAIMKSASNDVIKTLLEAGASCSVGCPSTWQNNVETIDYKNVTPIILSVRQNRLDYLELMIKDNSTLNYFDSSGATALSWALSNKLDDITAFLIKKGADVNLRSHHEDAWTPIFIAIVKSAPTEVIKALVDGGADCSIGCIVRYKNDSDNTKNVTPIIESAATNRLDDLQIMVKDKAMLNIKDSRHRNALGCAIINKHLDVAHFLIKQGADPNVGSDGTSPLFVAVQYNLDLTRALVEAGAVVDGRLEPGGLTPLMAAAMQGQAATVEYLLTVGASNNIKDGKGWTAERHAAENRHQVVLDVIQKPQREAEREELKSQLTPNNIGREIGKRALNLVGFDNLTKQLAIDLSDFYLGHESKARIFWGQSAVGKTEFCQRLAGLKQGYPKFQVGPHSAFYISGIDGKLEIKQFVQQIPNDSILIIDEADKVLDPKAQMVSQSEAIQLQHAIVTYFSTKKIYWVFVGTFSALRGQKKLSYDMLTSSLGAELANRIDFADWEFPQWNLESLLHAVKGTCNRRGLMYDDEALFILANHCLAMGGGVRAFDNIDQSLNRKLSMNGSDKSVTKGLALQYINGLGAKIAA